MRKFSVVTIVLNHPEGLAATAASVASQEGGDFEWIVIDGGSGAPTQGVISAWRHRIDVLVSEPDKGLYDAMNKGIARATGEWIIFMNAGDCFAHSRVLASFDAADDDDLAYGYAIWNPPNGKPFVFRGRPLDTLWKGICFSHQALFARTELAKKLPFNTRYRIAADYEFYVRAICGGHKICALNYTIANTEPSGISERAFYLRTWERFMIVIRLYPKRMVIRYYAQLFFDNWLREQRSYFRIGARA